VEGHDLDEPVADALRAALDGHWVLDRTLAQRKHYPAIDPLASVSRLMDEVADPAHLKGAKRLLALLARYRSAEDLISIGAYVKGSDPDVDRAIALRNELNAFLTQGVHEKTESHGTLKALADLAKKADEKV
jgi:flagellum-specific ATP synthase